jgi:hypothetical protein
VSGPPGRLFAIRKSSACGDLPTFAGAAGTRTGAHLLSFVCEAVPMRYLAGVLRICCVARGLRDVLPYAHRCCASCWWRHLSPSYSLCDSGLVAIRTYMRMSSRGRQLRRLACGRRFSVSRGACIDTVFVSIHANYSCRPFEMS